MTDNNSSGMSNLRYQADESPPPLLTFGLGLQVAILVLPGVVFIPTIIFRAAGEAETYILWAVLASLLTCGITTILQAVRLGHIGAGYVLVMGGSASFIGVSITAVNEGGLVLLATLIVISSLVPMAISMRLSLLRRILTPPVMGTIIMLIPVTVMPIAFRMSQDVPDGSPVLAAPTCALVTLLIMTGISLKAKGKLRIWAPIIGVVSGSIVAGYFGIYDYGRVADSSWLGLSEGEWQGMSFDFGLEFWILLPAFIFIAMVDTFKSIGCSIAIQSVSWRQSKAVDFRSVQGSVVAIGTGNILAGILGTVPKSIRPQSLSLTPATGVGSRNVGIAAGIIFIAMAFFPKGLAVILAIPSPVVAGFLTYIMATIFVIGIRTATQEGLDYQKSLIVGIAFWIGVGFEYRMIFPDMASEFLGGLLQNGMITGGLTAIIISLFLDLTKPRGRRIKLPLELASLPKIREFLSAFSKRNGWDTTMTERLNAASEETLLTFHESDEVEEHKGKYLGLLVRKEDDEAVLEFVISTNEENLEDKIALLGDQVTVEPVEQEMSIRLLKHIASSVRHQQYYNTDIVQVRVKAPKEVA